MARRLKRVIRIPKQENGFKFTEPKRWKTKRSVPNLKRTKSGGYILPSGETISVKEVKALRSAVVTANRRRARNIEKLPEEVQERYAIFGSSNQYVGYKKSASIKHFRNRKEFLNYMKSVRKSGSQEQLIKTWETYRKNYTKALRNVFGNRANTIIKKINSMSLEQFREHSLMNEDEGDINFVYDSYVSLDDRLAYIGDSI